MIEEKGLPTCRSGEHCWEPRDMDERLQVNCWVCTRCHSIKRLIKGHYSYTDVDGNPFTYVPTKDEGEEALAYVEREIEKLKKKK